MIKSSLEEYLNNKPLYYDKIDFDIVQQSWDILSCHLDLPYVIHIVGTNGKGSTGRFLASFLTQLDKTVLHYSSPHIIEFNERIWLNGKNSTNQELDQAHNKIQNILTKYYLERLTYFEYTTLIALVLSDGIDYLVLEAGLGGEFDATNVVKNNLTLLTTIGLDHQDFLGSTIEEITLTKARSCDTSIIIGKQQTTDIERYVRELFRDTRNIVSLSIFDTSFYDDKLPKYLLSNLQLAFSALKYLNLSIKTFELPKLFGRYQKITSNIIIDVGHNPLAASVIKEQLAKENKKVILIYNSYKDKDYDEVLGILNDVVKEVQIIKCDDSRIVDIEILQNTLSKLSITHNIFNIKDLASTTEYYLVFGSFIVVENFLKEYNSGC